MKTIHFPYIALPLGLVFMLIISVGSQIDSNGTTALPLLTMLVMNEFAFIANLIGGYIGIKHTFSVGPKLIYTTITIGCILMAARLLFLGMALWPNVL